VAESEEKMIRRWLAARQIAHARTAELHRRDLQRIDIAQVIEDLQDAFESAASFRTFDDLGTGRSASMVCEG